MDGESRFALYFLEGQRLIQEIALRTGVTGAGFAWFRDAVLSVQPTIALIKRGEQLGFYIDAHEPLFRMKIETAHHGDMRCAIVPDAFHEFPDGVSGFARLRKIFPRGKEAYESIVELTAMPLREIVNALLRHSYQVHCAVLVSQRSDQSAMLHELPPIAGREDYEYSLDALRARRDEIERDLHGVFDRALFEPDDLRAALAELGFRLLADRPVRFRCTCSHERMVMNIRDLANVELQTLFDPGQESLKVTCDYCRARYEIGREEILGPGRAKR